MPFSRATWKSIATDGWYAPSWTNKATDGIYRSVVDIIITHVKTVWSLVAKTHKCLVPTFYHTKQRTIFTIKQHIIQASAIYYHNKERFLFYIKNHIVRTSAIITSFLDNLVTKIRIKAKVGKHV